MKIKRASNLQNINLRKDSKMKCPEIVMSVEGQKYIEQEIVYNNDNANEVTHFFEENETFSQLGSLNAFAAFNDSSLNKEIIGGVSQEQIKSKVEAQEKQNKIRQIHSQQYKVRNQENEEIQNLENKNEQNNDIGPLDQSEQVSFRKDDTLQYISRKVMDETVEQSIYQAANQQVQLKKSQMNVQISGQGQLKDQQNSLINPLASEQSINNPIQIFEQNQIINLQYKASIIQNRFNQEALQKSMKQSLQEAISQGESGQEIKSKGQKNSIKTVISSLNEQSENRNILFQDDKIFQQNSINQNKYKKNQKILKKHISQIEKLKNVMKKKQFYRNSPNNEKIVEQISRSFELYEQKEQTLKIIKASIEEMEDLINKNSSIIENNEKIDTGQSRPISRVSLDLIKKQDTKKNVKSKKEGVILKLKQYLPLQEIQQLNKQENMDQQSPKSSQKVQQNSPKAFFNRFMPNDMRKYKRQNSQSIISAKGQMKQNAHIKRLSNLYHKQREISDDQLIIQINQNVELSKNFIHNLSQKKKYFEGKQSNYIKSQKVSQQKFQKANQKNVVIDDNKLKVQTQKLSARNNKNFNIHNLLNQQNDFHLKQMNSRRSLQYSKRSEANLVQNLNYNEVDLNQSPVMALLPRNQILNVFSSKKQRKNILKQNIVQNRSGSQISQNLINADLNEFVNKSIPRKKQFQILDDIISDRQLSTKYINNSRIRETQELDEIHSSKSKQIFQSREEKLMSKYNKYKSASFKQIISHEKSSGNQKSASFKLDNESLQNRKIKINNSYLIKKGIQTGVNSRQNILISQSKNIYKSTMKLDLIVKQVDLEDIDQKCKSQKKINLSTQNTQKVNLNNDSQTNRNNLESQLIESAQINSENADKEFKITPDIMIHSAKKSYENVKPIFFIKNKDLVDENNIANENQNYQILAQNLKVNEIKTVSILSDQQKSQYEIQSNIASEKNAQKLIQEQATQQSGSHYDFSLQKKSVSPIAKILSEDALYRRRQKEEFELRNKQLADRKADLIKSPKQNTNAVNYKLMNTKLQKLGNVSMICKREETILNQKTVQDKYLFLTQPLSLNQLGFEKVMSGYDDLSFRAHLNKAEGQNNFKQKALQLKVEAAQEEARLIKIEKENIKILLESKASKEQKELQMKEMKQLQNAKDPKILEQINTKADKIVYTRLNPILTLQNTNIELRDQSLFDLLKKNGGIPLSEQEVQNQLNQKYDKKSGFKNNKNQASENFQQKSQDIIHSLRYHNKIGTLKEKLESYIKENKKDQKLAEFTDEILQFYKIQINKPQAEPQLPTKMSKSSLNSQTNIIISKNTAQYIEQPPENLIEIVRRPKKKTFMKVDEYLKMKEDEKLQKIEQKFEDIEFQKLSKQKRGTSYFLTREERECVVQKLKDIHLLEEKQKQYEKEIKEEYLKKKEEKRLKMQQADMILFNNLRTKKQD